MHDQNQRERKVRRAKVNEALTKGKVSFVGFKVIVGLSYNVGFKLKWVLILVLFYVGFDVRHQPPTNAKLKLVLKFHLELVFTELQLQYST